jgi:hypothetical protein
VLENSALKRIFGSKRDEVMEGCRKLHTKKLHNLYSSPSIITMISSRRMREAGHVPSIEEKWNAYGILVGKPEGKRPLGRPRFRHEANIKMDLQEVGWGRMECTGLAHDRVQWRVFCEHSNEHSGSIKRWGILE